MRLGVFTNSLLPTSWKYYENYGRSDIREISREDFLRLLRNEKQNQSEISIENRKASQGGHVRKTGKVQSLFSSTY